MERRFLVFFMSDSGFCANALLLPRVPDFVRRCVRAARLPCVPATLLPWGRGLSGETTVGAIPSRYLFADSGPEEAMLQSVRCDINKQLKLLRKGEVVGRGVMMF